MIIAVGVENQPPVELCVTAIKIVFAFVLCWVEMWCNISHQLHKYQQRYWTAQLPVWENNKRSCNVIICDLCSHIQGFKFYNSISVIRSFTEEVSIRIIETVGIKYCYVVMLQNCNQIITLTENTDVG